MITVYIKNFPYCKKKLQILFSSNGGEMDVSEKPFAEIEDNINKAVLSHFKENT